MNFFWLIAENAFILVETKPGMIHHSVIFTLIHPVNSPEAHHFLQVASALKNIPGVRNFECVRQTSRENPYEYVIRMDFDRQKAYDEYSAHPDHERFVSEYWMKDVKQFLEIDYEYHGESRF